MKKSQIKKHGSVGTVPQPSLAAGGHIPKRHKLNIGHGNPNCFIINNKEHNDCKKMNHYPIGNPMYSLSPSS